MQLRQPACEAENETKPNRKAIEKVAKGRPGECGRERERETALSAMKLNNLNRKVDVLNCSAMTQRSETHTQRRAHTNASALMQHFVLFHFTGLHGVGARTRTHTRTHRHPIPAERHSSHDAM